jgi:ribosomal protein S3AE
MKRKYLEPAVLGVVLLTIIVLAAYPYLRGSKVTTTEMNDNTRMDERHYSTDLKKLREKFNQDKGKVRLILLLSPT